MTDSLASVQYYLVTKDLQPGRDDVPGRAAASVALLDVPATAEQEAQIILFHWTIPGTQGRVADVDEHNYLKCIVPVGAKRFAVNIADLQANILIPATGVRMVREKRTVGLRQPDNLNRLPDTLVRLMKMLRSAQSYCCDSEPELVTDEVCYVCLRLKVATLTMCHHPRVCRAHAGVQNTRVMMRASLTPRRFSSFALCACLPATALVANVCSNASCVS